MDNDEVTSLLAREFTKRIEQLGISRRELTRRVNISRQTIHHIENDNRTEMRPSTYAAIDKGLHWRPGTALALSQGNADVLAESDTMTLEDRTDATRWRIVARVYSMTLDELDRLVGMIDGNMQTNGHSEDDELAMLRGRLEALETRLSS